MSTRRSTPSFVLVWMITTLICCSVITASAQNPLPSATLPLLSGGSLSLQDLKGQVVVIRFLASW
jgi:hypothetical protein